MAFTVRMVILDTAGKPGIVLETRKLRARTLSEAKIEVDTTSWGLGPIEPTGLEIVDSEGAPVARRHYAGKNVYSKWT